MRKNDNNLLLLVLLTTIVIIGVLVYQNKDKKVENKTVQQYSSIPKQEIKEEKKIFTYEEALDSINIDQLKKTLNYLASDELEGRMSGKKGNVVAAEFIKKEYESYGLPTEYDKFSISRTNPGPKNETGDDFTQNIYAWIEGTDPALKDEIVVIGAHMDHIGYGPSMSRAPKRREIHNGADDNGSGTVALLEIAQAFSMIKDKLKRTVVFQSYSAEEMGLIGSRYYCNNPKFPKNNPNIKNHVAMINMDMIGYLNKGYYFAGFNEGESSIDLTAIINELNNKYSFAKNITSRGSGGSDHASFYNKRIPVAFLHTGLHAYYHTPDDDVDKINFDGITQIAKYAFELTYKVVQADNKPRFNNAEFKEMEYIHDHGHPETGFHSYHDHGHDHIHIEDHGDHTHIYKDKK